MGRLVVILTLLGVTGCPSLDVGQPIALVPESSWTAIEVETLQRAAECWNLQFGTHLELGRDTVRWSQEVAFRFGEQVCIYALARASPNLPVNVTVCPMRFFFDDPGLRQGLLFETLLHEMGHVLNIRAHAPGAWNVMSSGKEKRKVSDIVLPRFTVEDQRLFREANPGFVALQSCEVAVDRLARPPICGCVP
jgi:hypothetical protein